MKRGIILAALLCANHFPCRDVAADAQAPASAVRPEPISTASYGGYAAMWGATRNPERYRCAASLAGVSDVARQLKFQKDFFRDTKSARKWQTRVQGDATAGDISPLDHVDRLKVPILLAHGKDDHTVPIKQSELYAAALKKAGKPYEYYSYDGEGHSFDGPVAVEDFLDRLEAFLKRYNPAE